MTGETKWWWRAAGAGLIVLLMSFGFGLIPDIEACTDTGDVGSIIAFELVRTPGEVAALFGEEPCRGLFTAAMRQATWIDALGFIPAYSAFLICALVALRGYGRRIALAGVAAVLIAAISDEIEGALLFAIMDSLPGTQGQIDGLIVAVRAKFALLGLASIAIGWLLIARRSGFSWLAGAIIGLGGIVSLALLLGDRFAPTMLLGATLSWATLFLTASGYAVAGWARAQRAAA